MSPEPIGTSSSAAATSAKVPPPSTARTDGLAGIASFEDPVEKRVDEIEMIGEEEAAGFTGPVHSEVTAGMRYLHCSRTIHQLITDRNRAVGLYLAVASLLWTGSSALVNAHFSEQIGNDHLPWLLMLQRWCLPATFAMLVVLALFVGFLLIRTRIGLIYEVAKMNILLGLPVGRVKRVNPLSIFFIMHALISLAGGCSGAILAAFFFVRGGVGKEATIAVSCLIGVAITLLLIVLYIGTVRYTTADRKLQDLTR